MAQNELDQEVRAKQPTSAAHLWQLLQKSLAELSLVYLQSLVERMPKICEAEIIAKGIKGLRSFLCFLGLICILCDSERHVFSIINKTIVVLNLFH